MFGKPLSRRVFDHLPRILESLLYFLIVFQLRTFQAEHLKSLGEVGRSSLERDMPVQTVLIHTRTR